MPKSVLCLTILLLSPRAGLAIDRTVVLSNGNVIQGDVQQLEKHVVVRTATAELHVPNSEVDVISRDLQSAYLAKAVRGRSGSPTFRENLIRWCLRVGLIAEARQELNALRQDAPSYAQLPALRKDVNNHGRGAKSLRLPSQAPLPQDRQFALDRLDRLSKLTLAEYARHVQPLLVNRCGQAGCHGKSTKTNYGLMSFPGSRFTTGITRQNLGATLQKIEGPADQSSLWLSAKRQHGGLKKSPMSEHELTRLQNWIRQAASDLDTGRSDVRQASAHAKIEEGVDPFDPAEFNSAHTALRPGTAD